MSASSQVWVFIVAVSCFQPVYSVQYPFLARTRKVIKIEYFENCDHKVYPITAEGFTFVRNGSTLVINGELVVLRDIDSKNCNKIEFRIEKCKDKSNPDTCEYYTTWKWDDKCACIKLPFAGAVVNTFTPPYECPEKKNRYRLKDTKLRSDLFEAILAGSQTITLWKFRLQEYDATSVVACMDFGIRLVGTRMRD